MSDKANRAAAQGPDAEVLRALRAARERIARGWCQEINAVNAAGKETSCYGDNAVAWCALVAIQGPFEVEKQAQFLVESVIDGDMVTHWNDAEGRTQAEVLAAFDLAIAKAEGRSAPKGALKDSK